MKEFSFSTVAKVIDGHIKAIVTVGKTFFRNTHIVACECIVHALVHGDITLIQRLDEAIGIGGFRRAGFRQFMQDESPCNWQRSDKLAKVEAGWVYDKVKAAQMRKAYDANPAEYTAKLLAETWYERNPEKNAEPVILLDKLAAFYGQMKKKKDGKQSNIHDIPDEEMVILSDALSRIRVMHKPKTLALPAPQHVEVSIH